MNDERKFRKITMNAKIMAIITAVAMVAVTGFVAVGASDGSDADSCDCTTCNSVAQYHFYVYSEDGWVSYSGSGYNAWSALKNASGLNVSMDGMTVTEYGYTNISSTWGHVNSVNGDSTTWNIYYYNVAGSWVSGVNALGFYNAYSDYDSDFRTANIALYNENTASHLSELPSSGLAQIVTVHQCDCFKVNFTITNGSVSNTYVGYGSNVYLALKSITALNVVGNGAVMNSTTGLINNSSYGYITSIGGCSESSVEYDDHIDYTYWSLNIGETSSVAYASFLAGFYTPIFDSNFGELDQIAYCVLTFDNYTWVF